MKGISESEIGEDGYSSDSVSSEAVRVDTDLVSDLEIDSDAYSDSDSDSEKDKRCKNAVIFPQMEEAIKVGNITFRERMFNTMYMCTNN